MGWVQIKFSVQALRPERRLPAAMDSRCSGRDVEYRAFPAQQEEANYCQRVREHHAENDVGVELVVASAQGEDCGPEALADQAEGRRAPLGWMTAMRRKKTPSCAMAR